MGTDRMGSGFGGERQGQEIVDAAIWAGTQSATPLGPANLAGTRSDSTMQQNWCRGPMQRIHEEHSLRAFMKLLAITFVMYLCAVSLDSTASPGAKSCRAKTSHGSSGLLDLIPERTGRADRELDTLGPLVADAAANAEACAAGKVCDPRTPGQQATARRRSAARAGQEQACPDIRTARERKMPHLRQQHHHENSQLLV